MSNETISFSNDIAPFFKQFRHQMMWRFDLTSYDDVKINHQIILDRITNDEAPMPPPPLPRLSATLIQDFEDWIKQGFPA